MVVAVDAWNTPKSVVEAAAPQAPIAGAIPKGEVDVVWPSANALGEVTPIAAAGAVAGAQDTKDFVSTALLEVPKPVVLPNVCGRKWGGHARGGGGAR